METGDEVTLDVKKSDKFNKETRLAKAQEGGAIPGLVDDEPLIAQIKSGAGESAVLKRVQSRSMPSKVSVVRKLNFDGEEVSSPGGLKRSIRNVHDLGSLIDDEPDVFPDIKRIRAKKSTDERVQISLPAALFSSTTLSVEGPEAAFAPLPQLPLDTFSAVGLVTQNEIDEVAKVTGFEIDVVKGIYNLGLPNPKLTSIKASILNGCLSKEMRMPFEHSNLDKAKADSSDFPETPRKEFKLDYTLLTPEKIDQLKKYGGNLSDLFGKIDDLKQEHPSPARNPDEFSRKNWHSPAARADLSRKDFRKAMEGGIVTRLRPAAYLELIIPETEDERKERKEKQVKDFLEAEKKRGKNLETLSIKIKNEYEIWRDYLNYIELRKEQIYNGNERKVADEEIIPDDVVDDLDADQGDEAGIQDDVKDADASLNNETKIRKIRRLEIEDVFYQYVANKLTHVPSNNYDLYITEETFDPHRLHPSGETNLEVMKDGRCPIGPDGKLMNYHHLTHYDFVTHGQTSIIVLLTDTLHKTSARNLHFTRATYRDLPRRPVTRKLFDPEREDFNKTIARCSF